jgi:hypothetical protein
MKAKKKMNRAFVFAVYHRHLPTEAYSLAATDIKFNFSHECYNADLLDEPSWEGFQED